jgi:hypothetical protein
MEAFKPAKRYALYFLENYENLGILSELGC